VVFELDVVVDVVLTRLPIPLHSRIDDLPPHRRQPQA